VRFAVIGDAGTGDRSQYEVATQIIKYHQRFPFTFAILLGDNIYGSERPQDFAKKFERPYKALLDDGVEFHAALGNHDDPNQKFYKRFNLGGQRYRTFKKGNVRFFVLDSNYLDPEQIAWLEKELAASGSDWKIAYFHHPLYTTARRGPEVELRSVLEPILIKHGVSVVFQGHEHIYERLHPQKGIQYFTAGGSAKLRSGDTRPGELTEVGFASDRSFMPVLPGHQPDRRDRGQGHRSPPARGCPRRGGGGSAQKAGGQGFRSKTLRGGHPATGSPLLSATAHL
jgi:hypothetical protein